jgi:hypothetical protein
MSISVKNDKFKKLMSFIFNVAGFLPQKMHRKSNYTLYNSKMAQKKYFNAFIYILI